MFTVLTTTIAGTAAAAAGLWGAARWTRTRRARRGEAIRRLEAAMEGWYRAGRSFESDATAYAFQLRSFGQAALDCAEALATLERDNGHVAKWEGPPFKPAALARAGRPVPPDLWHKFDHAFEEAWSLMHPVDNCVALGTVTVALADWIEKNRPIVDAPEPQPANEEHAGSDAAFVHAVSAPCLASLAAENTFRQEQALLLSRASLAEEVDADGSDAQRTMLGVALALASAGQADGPTIGELLTLEDTDLCHALEAVALARRLSRVYPAQRPELLWMHAALAESDSQQPPGQLQEEPGSTE